MTAVTRTINVTAEHIANGRRDSGCGCPIALAMRAAGFDVIWVSTTDVTFGDRVQRLPPIARRFINSFDDKREVEPFSFELEVA